MAKSSNRPRIIVLIAVIAVAAVVAFVWMRKRNPATVSGASTAASPATLSAPVTVSADRIDPAREGHNVAVSGALKVDSPARDTQLGISADALMLLRFVEMLQWREQCVGEACTYRTIWASQPIDSRKFRQPKGHENPQRLPMTNARFAASGVRLGAFAVDAGTLGSARGNMPNQVVAYPVKSAQLPANLAMSFRDVDGVLYGGNDPTKPAVGDVRFTYRIIPAGTTHVTGIQRGERLLVQKQVPSQQKP
jgi:hypothetical protein